MVDFRIDIFADIGSVDRIFAHMAQAVSMPELYEFLRVQVDPYIRTRISRRFTGEGDDVVGNWAPLAPSTEHIRAFKGYSPSHPINVRDHYMRDFLVGTPGNIVPLGTTGAVLTHPGVSGGPLTDQKIETAQMGKAYPRTPPRPVMGMNEADLAWMHFQLVHHIFSGMK